MADMQGRQGKVPRKDRHASRQFSVQQQRVSNIYPLQAKYQLNYIVGVEPFIFYDCDQQ